MHPHTDPVVVNACECVLSREHRQRLIVGLEVVRRRPYFPKLHAQGAGRDVNSASSRALTMGLRSTVKRDDKSMGQAMLAETKREKLRPPSLCSHRLQRQSCPHCVAQQRGL